MKQIAYTLAASRQMAKLTSVVRARIAGKIDRLAETGEGDIKALKGVAALRLRVGDWRVIYNVSGDTLTVLQVAHRREVY